LCGDPGALFRRNVNREDGPDRDPFPRRSGQGPFAIRYAAVMMVDLRGFEPRTSCLPSKRSTT
jgi:hypothetical protein